MKLALSNRHQDPDIGFSESTPTSLLYLAVLGRSLRDLTETNRDLRMWAIEWFEEWKNHMPRYVSYKDVRDHVELSDSQLRVIQHFLAYAKDPNSVFPWVISHQRYVIR